MASTKKLAAVLEKHWGYDSFLPLQREAMESVLDGVDSIVVLPTGGGKSLCYQAPAVVMDGTAIVVSPLISLMKDQVDSLDESGVSAARIDSSLEADEKGEIVRRLRAGELKLLYVAPERLMMASFQQLLADVDISFVAVDEAHCVSMWGHDFRPEYRQLGSLKKVLDGICIHAYTATATPQVRDDIAVQLHLDSPSVHVGSFDRPNLNYRTERRSNRLAQVCRVIERHRGESGIVYCIRRRDVDELAAALSARGYRALPYHAGMLDEDRKRNQEAFIRQEDAVIVATVAFGMGIDKPDVRFVVHAGMPKSVEHYQQESGRAGRDGLPAECCLFYSGQDFRVWQSILGDMPDGPREVAERKLSDMWNYGTALKCRHRMLVQYFGQDLPPGPCGACDVCEGDLDVIDDALVVGQKILSCVVRLQQRFGADYTSLVLVGSKDERIMRNYHDNLSTYGLLSDHPKRVVRDWIEQMVDRGYLRKAGEFSVLQVTPEGREVLSGNVTPQLLKPPETRAAKRARTAPAASRVDADAPVDEELMGALRKMRSDIARKRRVPAYVVFGDVTLRELAAARPTTGEALLLVHGIGEARRKKYGDDILEVIRSHVGNT